MSNRNYRVAVVGAGPSGIYATEKLVALGDVSVDVFERLPAPFGLLRYGVAPDHLKIKASIALFQSALDHPEVRFFGNVEVGSDVSVDALRQTYDAVFFAFGASEGRALGVPGQDLVGSITATEFVNWYNGHPDSDPDRFVLDADSVVIVGMGNVAVDVARVLAKSADELRSTDLPDQVLRALEQSKVQDIHVVARRGPVHAKFSLPALMEMGELANADLIIKESDLVLDAASAQVVHDDRRVRQSYEVLQRLAAEKPKVRPRRIHLHFFRSPVSVEGAGNVTGLLVERMRIDQEGKNRATGFTESISAQLIIGSVGYRGRILEGLPFDETTGVVPNLAGRVLDDGVAMPGVYVTGWIRRGPQGVIGTNRADAAEVVAQFADDRDHLPQRGHEDPALPERLAAGLEKTIVDWAGWAAVDGAEIALGQAVGTTRMKIQSRAQMLDIAARTIQEGKK